MAKDALGRGLGNLLGGAKPVSEPKDTKPDPSKVSPGMATLLQGQKKVENAGADKTPEPQPAETEPQPPETEVQPGYRKLIRISLFVADGLLVILAARVAFKSGGSFGLGEVALCAGAMAMGAWLTVVAMQMKS